MLRSLLFFANRRTRDVPNADGAVQGAGNYEIFRRVEFGRHDVVRVASENGNALSRLPVPDADSVIVRGGDDPGIFVMELNGSDVVQMVAQGEDAAALLVVPNLNLIVISSRNKQGLVGVESNATNGAFFAFGQIFLQALSINRLSHPQNTLLSALKHATG